MSPSLPNDRLGLALAGGGFRASLFHLGVLRRLAELDILRRVQVLSTVSGGSIIGAVYALRLKNWLEAKGELSRNDYVELIAEVDDILCSGIRKNLRTRLFLNPLTTLRVMLTHDSMGRAMARLYERHFLHDALYMKPGRRDTPVPSRRTRQLKQDLQLSNLLIHPALTEKGIDTYNQQQQKQLQVTESEVATLEEELKTPKPGVVTGIVINATTLNSGGRFFFSAVEIGDWYLGYFRKDGEEEEHLLRRRPLMQELTVDELRLHGGANDARQAAMALWLRTGELAPLRAQWPALFPADRGGEGDDPFPGDLRFAALGLLRRAKVAAWRLGRETIRRKQESLQFRFVSALKDIDHAAAEAVTALLPPDDLSVLADFVIECYLMRSAAAVSRDFLDDWEGLTLGDAVGASACFPPVFPPFVVLGIYDDVHVSRLGLTDGGAYDNSGVTALLDEGCTSVIASDTGGVFETQPASSSGHLGLMTRTPEILMRALGGYQRLGLLERWRVTRDLQKHERTLPPVRDALDAHKSLRALKSDRQLNDFAYFKLDTPAPEPPCAPQPLELEELGIERRDIARVRTDLDCFGDIEMAALINHGYDTADRYVRRFMTKYRQEWWRHMPLKVPRSMAASSPAKVRKVMRAGRSRFFRAVQLKAPVTMLVLALVVAALLVGAVRGTSLLDLWAGALALAGSMISWADTTLTSVSETLASIVRGVTTFVPRYVVPWLGRRAGDPNTIVALVGIAAAAATVRVWLNKTRAERQEKSQQFRPARTFWKYVVSYRGNVLWLVWALPLIIAVTLSALTLVSLVVFFLPWRRAAALKAGTPGKRRTSWMSTLRARPASVGADESS